MGLFLKNNIYDMFPHSNGGSDFKEDFIAEDNYPLLDFNIHSQYCKKIAQIQMKSKLLPKIWKLRYLPIAISFFS